MSGPTLTRRELKAQAKQTLARWARPCMLASAALLLFTLLLEVVQAVTPGTSLSYFLSAAVEDYPFQTGVWRLDAGAAARLMTTVGLPAAFGGAGALLGALRLDAAGLVYLLLIPFRQIPMALLIQLAVLLPPPSTGPSSSIGTSSGGSLSPSAASSPGISTCASPAGRRRFSSCSACGAPPPPLCA